MGSARLETTETKTTETKAFAFAFQKQAEPPTIAIASTTNRMPLITLLLVRCSFGACSALRRTIAVWPRSTRPVSSRECERQGPGRPLSGY